MHHLYLIGKFKRLIYFNIFFPIVKDVELGYGDFFLVSVNSDLGDFEYVRIAA